MPVSEPISHLQSLSHLSSGHVRSCPAFSGLRTPFGQSSLSKLPERCLAWPGPVHKEADSSTSLEGSFLCDLVRRAKWGSARRCPLTTPSDLGFCLCHETQFLKKPCLFSTCFCFPYGLEGPGGAVTCSWWSGGMEQPPL